jgi:uncharacterized membrane-anchored protein YhcB (DUF1043 family)
MSIWIYAAIAVVIIVVTIAYVVRAMKKEERKFDVQEMNIYIKHPDRW